MISIGLILKMGHNLKFIQFGSKSGDRQEKYVFQVYSKEGKFICETQLDRGKYELEIDRRFKKICFTSDGIFALLMERGDEDEILRLVKSTYFPAP
jgi:hypothetical protein